MVTKTTYAALAAIAVALSLAVVPALTTQQASAKIEPVIIDQFCQNPSGHQPPGQQDSCQGEAQEEVTVTENQNPAGHAPPGQNP
jgi:hypothetical protein